VYKYILSVFMERQTFIGYENCYAYVNAMRVCVLCVCMCMHVNNLPNR